MPLLEKNTHKKFHFSWRINNSDTYELKIFQSSKLSNYEIDIKSSFEQTEKKVFISSKRSIISISDSAIYTGNRGNLASKLGQDWWYKIIWFFSKHVCSLIRSTTATLIQGVRIGNLARYHLNIALTIATLYVLTSAWWLTRARGVIPSYNGTRYDKRWKLC